MDSGATAWVLVSTALVLFMTPGLAFFYGGMVRAKNMLGMLMQNFFSMGLVSVLWALVGFSLAFSKGNGFIGDLSFAGLKGLASPDIVLPGYVDGFALAIPALAFAAYQMMFAVITPALITGATADRLKFSGYAAFLGLWVLFEGRVFAAADQIFPRYIVERMPHGLVGLIVAAIVAATMSTHSGTINALAASTTHDIYLPISGRSVDDPRTLKMGKLFALGWGIVLTIGALMFKQQGTPVVVIALSIASFTYGGLLGGFSLGLFWKRAIQRDALLGMSVGIGCMAFIVFAKQFVAAFPSMTNALGPFSNIAWPWYVLIGTSITFVTGVMSSFTHAAPSSVPLSTPGAGQ